MKNLIGVAILVFASPIAAMAQAQDLLLKCPYGRNDLGKPSDAVRGWSPSISARAR